MSKDNQYCPHCGRGEIKMDITNENVFAAHAEVTFSIRCKHCSRTLAKTDEPEADLDILADAIDELARKEGWYVVDGNVYCNQCAEEPIIHQYRKAFKQHLHDLLTTDAFRRELIAEAGEGFNAYVAGAGNGEKIQERSKIITERLSALFLKAVRAAVEEG